MSLLSPRPASGVAAPWPPAPVAPSVSALLLTLHRDLLRLCGPLERSVSEWFAQFETMSRITRSIEQTLPRWRTLTDAQAALERRRDKEEQRQERSCYGAMQAAIAAESSTAIVAAAASSSSASGSAAPPSPVSAEEDSFFAAAQPLHSSFSAAPSSATETAAHSHASDPDASLLASVGVLGCLPGHVGKLALQQQRQVEIASNLLTNMHHDLSSSFTQLSAAFDSVHELYAQNKKLLTPSQLDLWCSSTSSGSASAGSASGTSVEKGSAHKKSADKKKGAASGGKSLDPSDPPSNSALNILRRLESIESAVVAQFDAHTVAWLELQRSLREASNPRDAAAQFEWSKGEASPDCSADDGGDHDPPTTPSTAASASSRASPSKSTSRPNAGSTAPPRSLSLAGWFRLPHPAALDAWNARHALVDSRAACISEQWHLLKGKAPRELLSSAVWDARAPEEGEEQ